ncbi:MAG: peptidoglycan-associated lipoprotein Pal [Rickettsiales bacterium]
MSIFRTILITAAISLLAACSTTVTDENGENQLSSASRGQMEELEKRVGDRVFFEFDSSTISAEAQEILKKQAVFMSQNPDLKFAIEGHCDERGTREYNMALGERRANAAKQFLISLGIEASRLQTVSYGKERPAVLGSNEWAWSQNRRAVAVPK